MTRPNTFDPTVPTGAQSPRTGDDEIRNIKLFTQNGWNDMTATDRQGVGRQTHPLYGTNLNATGTLSVTGTSTLSGGVTGNLTGNVTGNVTGNTTGAHNGSVGATTPASGAFTSVTASGGLSATGGIDSTSVMSTCSVTCYVTCHITC